MLPAIFKQLLDFCKLSCEPPTFERFETRTVKLLNHRHPQLSTANSNVEWVSMNYIPFGEKSLSVAIRLYQQTASLPVVIENAILHEIVKTVKIPLALKYQCMSSSTWKLAVTSLMTALQTGLPVVRKNGTHFQNMWIDLAETLDQFLFPKTSCMIEDRGLEEIVLDEAIDCQVIELLRDEVLPFSGEIPHEFVLNVVVLLNKGSIHSATTSNIGKNDSSI